VAEARLMRAYADRDGPATRREILNTLRQEPGLTKSQLCSFLQLSWGTISHHVRLLEATGEVVRRSVQGRRRLFTPSLSEESILRAHLARDPWVPRLLAHLRENPGSGIQAMAASLELDRRIVRRHLDRLIASGYVAQTRDYRPQFFVIEQQRANGVIELARQRTRP
jgi:DNA-binding MarR family transcriptional regulator